MIDADATRGSVLNRTGGYDGGNRVFKDQLFLIAGFEHEGIFVEASNAAGEFNAAQQIDCDGTLFFARIVEKAILYILRWFIHLVLSLAPGIVVCIV